MNELNSVFTAAPKSTFELLSQPGLGYYIPAYQRPYSWGKDHTLTLLRDVVHGIDMLASRGGESITFLGTLILIHDVKFQMVQPQHKGELPSRVMLVIDGQQRVTTLLVAISVLHAELAVRIAQVTKKGAEFGFGLEWIKQRAIQTKANLGMTIYQDMNFGEGDFRFYPRAIRALKDCWSRKQAQARYVSPIAEFLHQYGSFARLSDGKESKKFQLEPGEVTGSHKALSDNWRTIRSFMRAVAEAKGGEAEDMPGPADIGKEAQEAIFQEALPDEVVEIVKDKSPTKERVAGQELLRLVLFARYLLDRVAVTEVVAKDDTYAFDIFEALNTTGDPLTAFDTFKPRIIVAEGESKYESSPSYGTVRTIELYLEQFKKAEDKHEATTRLLIPFALAETGRKLSKRLSDQRTYLKDEYEGLSDIEQKRGMVVHLAHTSEFLRRVWPDDSSERPAIPEFELLETNERQRTLFCLEVLRSAKHAVTVAPLVRFFAKVVSAQGSEKKVAAEEFAGAIRSAAAFLALWRGPRATTGNIDQQYRTLMAKGVECGAFARRLPPDVKGASPSLLGFNQALRALLNHPDAGVVVGRAEWTKRVAEVASYESGTVAKLLLFGASHDSMADSSNPAGLIRRAKSGTLDLLTPDRWREMTVEHIAPQRKSSGWRGDLYDDGDLRDRLGNLTLLPSKENSSVSNRSWEVKRLFYRILSTPDPLVLGNMMQEASAKELALSSSTQEILAQARLHAQLEALAVVAGEWQPSFVADRSLRLAELAWDRFAPWLGIASDDLAKSILSSDA